MAGVVVSTIPLVLVFIVAGRQLVAGIRPWLTLYVQGDFSVESGERAAGCH